MHAALGARPSRTADRIKLLYLEGDLDDQECRRQRAEIAEALAAIPADELPTSEAVGRRPAARLAGLSMPWTVATPEDRNKFARELFADVVVDNRTAVAVKPRPELALFFETLARQVPEDVTLKRKRRVSLQRVLSRRRLHLPTPPAGSSTARSRAAASRP
jgi:hypothetical protein